jgi:hypothetical protein
MNANHKFLKFAGIALVAVAGPIAALACSSSSGNAAPSEPVLEGGPDMDSTMPGDEGGSSGSSSGSGSGSSSGSGSGAGSGSSSGGSGDSGPDASAVCDPSATVGGANSYNTCSSFGCAGKYDNAAHHVPSPLPTP